ncbi:diguanylate cyclase domain-containing protein [Rhodoferax sp. BAB1]|uniref:bifunctional diguanylate cyclase/phosphodiesterase n=1 Tax=Rhodoferax sp. BAB1 TaxID=2741720 RepID=UPI0015755AFE|nr:diguanylate cyclase [Rhodoferax sp. BAB1]QKO21381.1 diguanylate cyclase [Rhodoferax sp. BAB1]
MSVSNTVALAEQPVRPRWNRLLPLVLVLLLGFALLHGWRTWLHVKDNEINNLRTVLSLSHQLLDRFFEQQQTGLLGLAAEIAPQGRLLPPAALARSVQRYQVLRPELLAIHVLSPQGRYLATSSGRVASDIPARADDPDFQQLLQTSALVDISRPHRDAAEPRWHFGMRHVLRDTHGRPLAVLIFAAPVDLLSGFWRDMPAIERMTIGVLRDDAYLLSRYPVRPGISDTEVYGTPRGGALRRHLVTQNFPATGQMQGINQIGGSDYQYAYERLKGLPITVYVAMPVPTMLDIWWGQMRATLLLLLLMGGSGIWAYRYLARRQRQWEAAREQAGLRLQGIIESAMDAIISVDESHRIVIFNSAAEAMFGHTQARVLGQPVSMLIPMQHRDRHDGFINAFARTGRSNRSMVSRGQLHALHADGHQFPIEAAISHVTIEGHQTFTVVIRDITARIAAQQELELSHHALEQANAQLAGMAHYDPLTGLPNRVLLADRLQQALAQTERRDRALAVAFLDLDGFKAVNDRYGHAAGDQFLVTMAHRLKAVLRDGDTLSRVGGDEFVALLVDLEQAQDVEPVLQRLLQAVQQPVELEGKEVSVSTSIGVALSPPDHAEPDQLIRHADKAMYQAKQAGKNRWQYFEA